MICAPLLAVLLVLAGDPVAGNGAIADSAGGTTAPSSCCPACANLPGVGRDSTGHPQSIDPYAGFVFDDERHRAWYRRFWTGRCEGAGLFCFDGRPNSKSERRAFWFDTIARSTAASPGSLREDLVCRLWRLGRVVGFEWARDNSIRRIDTRAIREWGKLLKRSTAVDLPAVLDRIEAEAERRLR